MGLVETALWSMCTIIGLLVVVAVVILGIIWIACWIEKLIEGVMHEHIYYVKKVTTLECGNAYYDYCCHKCKKKIRIRVDYN